MGGGGTLGGGKLTRPLGGIVPALGVRGISNCHLEAMEMAIWKGSDPTRSLGGLTNLTMPTNWDDPPKLLVR